MGKMEVAQTIAETVSLSSALHGERIWRRVATRDHVARDGRHITLAIWQTACVICGNPFQISAPLSGRSNALEVVTCPAHRMTPSEAGKLRFAKALARPAVFEAIKRAKLAK